MNDRDPVAEQFERFADDPLLLVMIFERKQVHRIEDDLQVIRRDGIQHPPHLLRRRNDMRCDRLDADDDAEVFGLRDKLCDARERLLKSGLAVVLGMRRIVRVDRAGFERDESVAEIAGVAQMFLEESEQRFSRRGIGVNRIHVAAEHRDLDAMCAKRLSDFERETGIQQAGFQIESGDGLSEGELRADHMLRGDFRGELAGRQPPKS